MRLGSGSERRRCIMQFSLAAGSESAVGDRKKKTDVRYNYDQANFSPLGFQVGEINLLGEL